MTELAAGYLNRERIARRIKARAMAEQCEVLSCGPPSAARDTATTGTEMPRGMAPNSAANAQLMPAA